MVYANVSEGETEKGNTNGEDYLYLYMQHEPLTTTAFYDMMAKRFAGKRVLDFGCGAGEFVARARKAGIHAFGVDRAPYAQLAKERLRRPIYASLDDVPEDFDVVLSHAVFEHLQNPLSLGRVLLSKLKIGGEFIISGVPNYNAVERRLGSFYNNEPPIHVNFFTAKALRKLCTDLGLKRIKVRSYGLPIWYFIHNRKSDKGVGIEQFNYVPEYLPERPEPSLLHRLLARVYYHCRVPTMGVALIASGIKTI